MNGPLPPFRGSRRSVRLRLTLIYSSLFLLAGAILLAVTYVLVAGSLPPAKQPFPTSTAFLDPKLAAACMSNQPTQGQINKSNPLTQDQIKRCKQAAEQAYASGNKVGVTDTRDLTLNHLMSYSIGGLAVMVLVSAALGWIVAGRVLRPVHAITAAARRASEENLGERIALAGPSDELKDLADTFDDMLARLEAAFASQRRFVANASHELRTPLTVMRTAIDVTLAKPGRTPAQLEAMAVEVRQAAERAEALIEALLTLARSDRGQGPRSQLDVAVFAEDALYAAVPEIKSFALNVQSCLEPGVAVGDPVLVERLVTNLIDNAVRHNVPNGWMRVSTGNRDGMAFIAISNGGPVIREPDVASLFEPFRRLCPDRGPTTPKGVGLGLSIVQSVVTAHRGQVTARPVPAGGLEVRVLLPAD
ncbi:MAG TPA: ATP-binding protein [Trebonia sp.]